MVGEIEDKKTNKNSAYLFQSYDVICFHYFLPIEPLSNAVKQLGYLFVFHRT